MQPHNPQARRGLRRFAPLLVLLWLLPSATGGDIIPRGLKPVDHEIKVDLAPEYEGYVLAETFDFVWTKVTPVQPGQWSPGFGKYGTRFVLLPPGTPLPKGMQKSDLPKSTHWLELPVKIKDYVPATSSVTKIQTHVRVQRGEDGIEMVLLSHGEIGSNQNSSPSGPPPLLLATAVAAAAVLLIFVLGFRRSTP